MRSYSDFSLRDLVEAFASTAPAPAGGSAAALTGATGASLLLMAADIRLSRPGASPDLAESADRLRSIRPTLIGLIDRDAESYAAVIAALRLPDEDDESRGRRRHALASAMQAATDVPLETMRASRLALRTAPVVASNCVRSTGADVAVAIELLHAAVRGAGRTVDANLASSADATYVERVRTEREQLQSESAADVEHALSLLNGRR